jgi:hypothetical protein
MACTKMMPPHQPIRFVHNSCIFLLHPLWYFTQDLNQMTSCQSENFVFDFLI